MNNQTALEKNKTKLILVGSTTAIVVTTVIVKRRLNARDIKVAENAVATWMELNQGAGYHVLLLPQLAIDKINSVTDNALKFVTD